MNYAILDHLEILTSKDNAEWHEKLVRDGVLDQEGSINANKLNLMAGSFVSPLLDNMQEADMNINEVYEHFKKLHEQNEFRSMYYLLYVIYSALEVDLPYLFLAISCNESVMKKYMDEFILDFEDCMRLPRRIA